MKIIGITGPTGAGKTTALRALEQLNVCILDADAVYHELLSSSALLRKALTSRFGAEILDGDGQVDRKKLGTIVFADPAALADLNGITHRFVLEELERRTAQAERVGKAAAAIDAISLIESGLGNWCDAVVGVLAPKELRIRRIMAREGISEEYARKRADAQKGDDFFRANCDFLLENGPEDSPEQFAARALALMREILTEA